MLSDIRFFLTRGSEIISSDGPRALAHYVWEDFTQRTDGRLERIRSDRDTPAWIKTPVDPFICRDLTAEYRHYGVAVTGEQADDAVVVNPDEAFDAIEFEVVGRAETPSFTVSVEFETVDGGSEEQCKQYVSGDWDRSRPVSISVAADHLAERARLSLDFGNKTGNAQPRDYFARYLGEEYLQTPRMTLPAARRKEGKHPPVILVSVDSLRHDHLKYLGSLLDALGDDAVVPAQPRTHAPITSTVHASLFTGTFPGDHGYVRWGNRNDIRPIDPSMTTLPQFLSKHGYKCSGLVNHWNLDASYGFGDGFHRYQLRNINWADRKYDLSQNLNQLLDWLSDDVKNGSEELFYFLHLFDAHYPYFPPETLYRMDAVDQQTVAKFRERESLRRDSDGIGYIDVVRNRPDVGADVDMEHIRSLYADSIRHISDQLVRLVEALKRHNMYRETLLIVFGDHGEEFFERGFGFHGTLYDAVIRPGMIVKPPLKGMKVPDAPDLIDIFPTLAQLVDSSTPEQAVGRPWQEDSEGRPRIAEQIWEDYYCISVEIDSIKGIFTYESNCPDRPTAEMMTDGPIETEYYDVSAVQSGDFTQVKPSTSHRRKLISTAEELMQRQNQRDDTFRQQPTDIDSDIAEQLEKLGYR